jgi:hypothetical protein
MKMTILLLILLAVTIITGCTTNASNQVSGQAYNPYTPPPQAGVQQNPNPPPQPLAQGYGCGI